MKTSNLFLLAIMSLSFLLTSCSKDDDKINLDNDDILVGLWDVNKVTANAYVDGLKIEGITVAVEGTLEFKGEDTGFADFTLTFAGEASEARGSFTWKRDGFELIIDMGDEDFVRYAIIDSEDNLQRLQFIDKDEDSDDEVELTFELIRVQ